MLKLSRMTDYGVVVLRYLAERQGETMTAPDLAEKTTLPQPTVAKILKALARGGVLASHRGTNGGYSLDRAPDRVTVAEVISALDGPVALTACVDGSDDTCSVESLCPMAGRWDRINVAVEAALESVSLAEIVGPMSASPFMDGTELADADGRTASGRTSNETTESKTTELKTTAGANVSLGIGENG